jgi:exonuclease III
LQVKNVEHGEYIMKMQVRCKTDRFEWAFVLVYGAAQDEHKGKFLAEMVKMCESEPLPMLVGGDFNILRQKEDKNNDIFHAHWPFIFNAII